VRKDDNKLVRDRIPEVIQKAGRRCETKILSESEYRLALRQKLLEEAEEVRTASDSKLAEELADVLEVVEALMESQGISAEEVASKRDRKRAERGGFERKILLLWTE
jgi:predicted house-cleaning noncanonical NTP pyrophosphatase (MazG superfamily)